MSFVIKTISALLIIITVYVLSVFLIPEKTDDFAKMAGIYELNEKLRNLKSGSDEVSDQLLQIKGAEQTIDKARQMKDVVDQKIEQTNKVIDSVNKVSKSIKEVNENVSELTTFTGGSSTGAKEEDK